MTNKKRMIIARAPLRISFVGGSTDLPVYYRQHGPGACISAAINKYIYVIVNKKFDNKIRVSYSKTEIVDRVDDIAHPLVREALRKVGITGGIEVVSISDIPSEGTGLGSSSVFTVCLLNALHAWNGDLVSPKQLAEEAVDIEMNILKEPCGKQDQYISAFGGLQFMEFFKDETVTTSPIIMKEESRKRLHESLLLLYTGKHRKSSTLLGNQANGPASNVTTYEKMKNITYEMFEALKNDRLDDTGRFLHENWLLKKSLTNGISDERIDAMYDIAMKNGALGGKVIGAGGGGFLLFFAPPEKHDAIKMALPELKEERFDMEPLGSRIVYVGD